MSNYNIDWDDFVKNNIPPEWRKFKRLEWLKIVVKGVKDIYSRFLTFRQETIYDVSHTSQVIYLEKLLNDQYDPNNRDIYIDLKSSVDQLFVFKTQEQRPFYIYWRWDDTINYQPGDFASWNGRIWKCLVANTNVEPNAANNTEWEDYKKAPYIYMSSEYGVTGFIVYVPVGIQNTFNESQMHAWIRKKKLAGVVYIIVYY